VTIITVKEPAVLETDPVTTTSYVPGARLVVETIESVTCIGVPVEQSFAEDNATLLVLRTPLSLWWIIGTGFAERLTVPEKPFELQTLTVTMAEPPAIKLAVLELAEIQKLGTGGDAAVTVTGTLADAETVPFVPVTSALYVAGIVHGCARTLTPKDPFGVLLLRVIARAVSVAFGPKALAVWTAAVKAMVPVKPYRLVTTTLDAPKVPWARLREFGVGVTRNGGENALALATNWTASVTGAKELHGEPPQTLMSGFSVELPGCVGGRVRPEDPGAKNCNCTLKRVLGVEPIVTDRPNSSVWRNSRVPVP